MQKSKVMDITKMAVVVALILLLGLTPLGFINIGMLQITTVHAVVIIVTILFGFKIGLLGGAVFGLTSLITAIMTPGLFSPIFYNPIVSIVPRIILAVVAYYLFKFLQFSMRKIENKRFTLAISAAVTAAVATLVHTLLVLGLIWVFRWMSPELTSEMLNAALIGIALVNLPSELILATAVSGLIVPVLYPFFHKTEAPEVLKKEVTTEAETKTETEMKTETETKSE